MGALLIIGGHEDKEDDPCILRALVERVGAGKLVVCTVASEEPDDLWKTYVKVFGSLGLKKLVHFHAADREDARSEKAERLFDDATGIFFTGGDQLKLTSRIGDTPAYQRVQALFQNGGIVAGTSAGASAMSDVMMVRGEGRTTPAVEDEIRMAPGFGLIRDVIIDQHFAERGRLGRLLGAVAQNPRVLGIGLDEDTAVLVQKGVATVIGSGAAYVVDGSEISHSNLTEAAAEETISIFDVKLHVLSAGDSFKLEGRKPKAGSRPEKAA